ncbi:lck-interacting transmembrane adapter 1, partial [Carlito syrichta]|uniref:Lck-interacting transmembrane adapter 1 n=1 Tax=Carlito syrichta TaxID=1868482 RepID=A0A1U7T1D1_CARSF
SLLSRTLLCSLSKSDTRLHELHRPHCGPVLRPASMDLLHPSWLEVCRGPTRLQAAPRAFPPQEPPWTLPATMPSISPEATYSNMGLAAPPRASLAARPVVAEYACIQKPKGADQDPQELQLGKAEVAPDTQVDTLYSRVCKPKRRDPGPTMDLLDPKDRGMTLALGSEEACEALPFWRMGVNSSPLENVYESICEKGVPEPPALAVSMSGHRQGSEAPG